MRVKHKSHQKPQQRPVSPTLVAAVRPQDELSDWETDLLEALANGELNREEVLVLGTAMEPSEQGARSAAGPSDTATEGTIGALKERGITDDRIVEVLTDERVQSAIAEAEHKKAETDQKYQTADQREAARHGKNRGSGGEVSSDALFEVLDTIGAGVESLAEMGDWQLMAAMVGLDLASGGIVKTVLKQLGLIDKLAKGAGVDLEKLTGQLADKILAYSKGTDIAGLKKLNPAKLARARLAANALVSSMLLGTKKAAKRIRQLASNSSKVDKKSTRPSQLQGRKKNTTLAEQEERLQRSRLGPVTTTLGSGAVSTGLEGVNIYFDKRHQTREQKLKRLAAAFGWGLLGGGVGSAIPWLVKGGDLGATATRVGLNTTAGGLGGLGSAETNTRIADGRSINSEEFWNALFWGGLFGAGGGASGESAARIRQLRRPKTDREVVEDSLAVGGGATSVGDEASPPFFSRSILPPSRPLDPVELNWVRWGDAIGDAGAVFVPNSAPLVDQLRSKNSEQAKRRDPLQIRQQSRALVYPTG